MPVQRPHRFTVAEYHRMAEAGILGEGSRVELIRGQIVDRTPIGAPHLGMVNRLTRLLSAILAGHGILSVQNPVRLDDGSEPEPDIAVLRPRANDYQTATPCPPGRERSWISCRCPASRCLPLTCFPLSPDVRGA
jgi:hypothetical protein